MANVNTLGAVFGKSSRWQVLDRKGGFKSNVQQSTFNTLTLFNWGTLLPRLQNFLNWLEPIFFSAECLCFWVIIRMSLDEWTFNFKSIASDKTRMSVMDFFGKNVPMYTLLSFNLFLAIDTLSQEEKGLNMFEQDLVTLNTLFWIPIVYSLPGSGQGTLTYSELHLYIWSSIILYCHAYGAIYIARIPH